MTHPPRSVLAGIFIMGASLAATVHAAPPKNFEDYKGSYKGSWTFQTSSSGVTEKSSVGVAKIVISSSKKGRAGKVVIALGPITFAGSLKPADKATIRFANSVMSMDDVVPSILPRQPASGVFSIGGKAITGRIAQFIAVTAVNTTLTMTTSHTKKRQTVRIVYDGALVNSQVIPIHYEFDVSRRLH